MFFLLVCDWGVDSKVYAIFISNFLTFIAFFIIIIKNKFIGFLFDFSLFKKGVFYAGPLLPNQMSYWVTQLSDNFIVERFKGMASTGVYGIGYQLGQTITMFINSIFHVYQPLMFSMLEDDHDEGVKRIEFFIPMYISILMWLGFCIGFFAEEALYILTPSEYHGVFVVTQIVVVAYLFAGFYRPFVDIISFHNKTWIISFGGIIQATGNIVLNILFIPVFGYMAAALTTMVSYMFYFVWNVSWALLLEKMQVRIGKILLNLFIITLIIIMFLLIDRITEFSIWIDFIVKISLLFLGLSLGFITNALDRSFFAFKKK